MTSQLDKLVELLATAGQSDRYAEVIEACDCTYILRAGKKETLSRLGGLPLLPKGTRWPMRKQVPREFLGQIALKELPYVPEPLAGQVENMVQPLLLFFRSTQWETSDMSTGRDRYGCSAVYLVEGAGALASSPKTIRYEDEFADPRNVGREKHQFTGGPVDAPKLYPALFVETEMFLSYGPTPALESTLDPNVRAFLDRCSEEYEALDTLPSPVHRMFGFPTLDDSSGEIHDGDCLLLSVDSDERTGFSFGDANVLSFVCKKALLGKTGDNGAFPSVRLYAQLA